MAYADGDGEQDEDAGVVYTRGGGRRWWRVSWWRVVLAELVGAGLLLALGCMAVECVSPTPPLHAALAFGLVVVLLVQTFEHVSGAQLNPTVTLAAALSGHVPPPLAAAMTLAQLAGATVGYGALRNVLPTTASTATAPPTPADLCVTAVAAGLQPAQAVCVEAVLGGALALANLAQWDSRNRHLRDSWPARAGLVVTALSLAGGPLTGAGMNPARSFAPAFWNHRWEHHWVYWVGPLLGSVLCTGVYRRVWQSLPGDAPRDAPRGALRTPPATPPAPVPSQSQPS